MFTGILQTANLWARLHLGAFFAQRSEVQAGHCLVESGPYAYVRHPIFLVNLSVIVVALAVGAFGYFSDQARQDERLLSQHLLGYAAYEVGTDAHTWTSTPWNR
jgi:protein-S-isoprenylcysteine O-methyltransferase Ste14